jgi:hypothetical protein
MKSSMYLSFKVELKFCKNFILGSLRNRVHYQRYQQVSADCSTQILSSWQNQLVYKTAQHVWLPQEQSRSYEECLQPSFVSEGQSVTLYSFSDLLITIKRKIKEKNDQKLETAI